MEYKVVDEDGKKMYFMATQKNTGFSLSGSIEPGPGKGNAKDCREYHWHNLKQGPFKFEQLKMAEVGQKATLEYVIREHEGMPINQKNVFTYWVKDDYWLYLHLSKSLYRPEDALFLESVLSKVGFHQKNHSQKSDVRYSITKDLDIVLSVPQTWTDEYTPAKDGPFPTITLSQGNSKDTKMVSPIPLKKLNGDFRKSEMIRKMIEDSGTKLLPNAVEKKIELKEVRGAVGSGFYCTLTDKNPRLPDGEFRYMNHGGLVAGDLLVMFTIFTNDNNSPVLSEAIQMLESAKQ